ncbi:MAG: Nif3-like dinuclear metal center hexameric protein, partial [Ignavibacteriales bacterium]|nr:Nif3-like dinuclear metal center hexameric protein [Ignavibacteriales bacterium]
MTRVRDIHRLIAAWAPQQIAWERDNVGLQVGDAEDEVSGVLVCLDCTLEVVREAKRKKANLIVSHHPLLFRPPKSITKHDSVGRLVHELIAQKMNLYSAHTNLDFTRGGTSFAIAEALGLEKVEFLQRSYQVQRKVVTFVPEDRVAAVREAMAKAGAGIIGNYDHCSFAMSGTGSFRGNELTAPARGSKEQLEQLPEVRLEMIVDQWKVNEVVSALKSAHPYEEVAFDVYPLENFSTEYGMGIIGTLKRPMQTKAFLSFLKRQLRVKRLRHSVGTGK